MKICCYCCIYLNFDMSSFPTHISSMFDLKCYFGQNEWLDYSYSHSNCYFWVLYFRRYYFSLFCFHCKFLLIDYFHSNLKCHLILSLLIFYFWLNLMYHCYILVAMLHFHNFDFHWPSDFWLKMKISLNLMLRTFFIKLI